MHRKSPILLLVAVLALIVVGLVMLISTSIFGAQADAVDGYREAKRQLLWLGLGTGACIAGALIDYRFWQRYVWVIFTIVVLLLGACFAPGIGMEVNGERRWIGIGSLQIQPSELAKLTMVAFLAYWFARYPDAGKRFGLGFVYPLAIVGAMISLILFEVDIGTTAVLAITLVFILFVAGVDWRFLTGLTGVGMIAFLGMLSYAPDRVKRIMAFIDPEKYRLDEGFQQWISLMAIGSGGLTGRGIGEGRLKMLYMPFAHTDFIFPMIAEEMGLIVTVLVVVAFITLMISGAVIAFHAPDRFGALLGFGLVAFISVQAFLNIGVTTSLLPNTGLTLPFVSYGGSSLVIGLLAIGILINIYRQGSPELKEDRDWVSRRRMTPRI
ncbi:MAG: putative peptidoglycan glycosyltransferase FtsW [Verrucomicrobiota bacterium]